MHSFPKFFNKQEINIIIYAQQRKLVSPKEVK